MEEIYLEIIAGLRDPFHEWEKFFSYPKPLRLSTESMHAHRYRVCELVKKEAVMRIAKMLRGELI